MGPGGQRETAPDGPLAIVRDGESHTGRIAVPHPRVTLERQCTPARDTLPIAWKPFQLLGRIDHRLGVDDDVVRRLVVVPEDQRVLEEQQ